MQNPYLHMKGISKHFSGIYVLKNVNLEAHEGEALALLGANGAGKSTLMNILGGIVRYDEGSIVIGGQETDIKSAIEAEKQGIGFIHQELALCPSMSVAENIFISRFPRRGGFIHKSLIEKESKSTLERLGCRIDVRKSVRSLSAGDKQLVEIARALLSNARIIIFDEPTSSLAIKEKERFFEIIKSLKKEGKAIIYITHFLDEIFTICDKVQVLRNGETAGFGDIKSFNHHDIVNLMVGDITVDLTKKSASDLSAIPVLRVKNLTRTGILHSINLELKKGEILGLWGLMGSGRTELVRAITGLDPINKGGIEIHTGKDLRPMPPRKVKKWIGLITENRRDDGLFLPLSVRENMSISSLPVLLSKSKLFVNKKKEESFSNDLVAMLDIKATGIDQSTGTLSGGNQQKVIIARWLGKRPPIFIMDEPTRGVDVGAKNEIHKIIRNLSGEGFSVIVISSEIEEIMELSDRYLVMRGGRIVKDLPGSASEKELMLWAAKGVQEETA